jgi:hypothetical protein
MEEKKNTSTGTIKLKKQIPADVDRNEAIGRLFFRRKIQPSRPASQILPKK